MKNPFLVLLFCLLSLLSFGTVIAPGHGHAPVPVKKESYVYICKSPSAYVYHSTTECRGLNKCTHGVVKVSLSDAVRKYGRRACKVCE